jgi:hypothetical protein
MKTKRTMLLYIMLKIIIKIKYHFTTFLLSLTPVTNIIKSQNLSVIKLRMHIEVTISSTSNNEVNIKSC